MHGESAGLHARGFVSLLGDFTAVLMVAMCSWRYELH